MVSLRPFSSNGILGRQPATSIDTDALRSVLRILYLFKPTFVRKTEVVDTTKNNTMSRKAAAASLTQLVAALPEIYQPIFDHPELSTHVSRRCDDRLSHIVQIYQTLEAKLHHPLRVLDLGCAQGFFSLSLAKLGATVYGVDFQKTNIAVCNALAAEHPDFDVRFRPGLIEDVITNLEQDQYDLVLGLSVFHHIVHRFGAASVQKMLTDVAKKTISGIFEMALASEPPDWAPSQPQNPRQLLDGYAFVHELARSGTHLSAISRPLYIASNRYWFLDDQAGSFDAWKTESHAFAHNASGGTRHYIFGNGVLAKLFTLDLAEHREANSREYDNEVKFLNTTQTNFKAPRLFIHGHHEREAWLVREYIQGELLLDKMRAKKPYDAELVLHDVLEQIAALEETCLYHDDLRTWNILIGLDGHATLIDYGAIDRKANDCQWPHNIFLSFMIFVREVISGNAFFYDPIRPPSFNPGTFPEPYRYIFGKLFELPPNEWRFSFLRDMFLHPQQGDSGSSASTQSSFAVAIQATEDACKIYQETRNQWRRRATQSEALTQQFDPDLQTIRIFPLPTGPSAPDPVLIGEALIAMKSRLAPTGSLREKALRLVSRPLLRLMMRQRRAHVAGSDPCVTSRKAAVRRSGSLWRGDV